MTWEFQATIADDIHRVLGPDGESAWGIDHRGFDADSPRALGSAEVDLPTGRASLLLVPAVPGGLVLDVVRAYQGLTEGELCTLFLGIVSALRDCTDPEHRLTLKAFGLDARGRPVLIPGVSAPLATSARRALGEMLYHAGHGSPWSACLLPVNIALAGSSPALRSVVGEFLTEPSSDAGLTAALAEVAESMRLLAEPAPLPLVPAEREFDPEAALTARLRAASGHVRSRSDVSAASAAESTSAAETLRAASRRPRLRRRHRRSPPRLGRWSPSALMEAFRAGLARMKGARSGRPLIIGAVCLTLCGGAVLWGSWPGADAGDGGSSDRQAADDRTEPHEDTGVRETDEMPEDEDEVARVLQELCSARAEALSDGDETALQVLTVPGSAAAAADELIDPLDFAGSDYAIRIDEVDVVRAGEDRIVATAQMHSSAGSGRSLEDFDSLAVEFELKRLDGRWKVEQVIETGRE